LNKNIPHGAGLGGGSSDAAATLRLLNRFSDAKLPLEQLSALGADLGSDVPFFIGSGAAICRGRGELIQPVPLPTSLNLVLLEPGVAVVLMAGSESTIFGILPEQRSADAVIVHARAELDPALWARVCHAL